MMKKYLSIIFITIAIAGSSCKKTYLDELKNNPNVPSVASPSLLLSGGLKTTAGILNGSSYTMYASWIGYLSWSTGFQANTALEQYQFTTSSYDVWTPLYGNIANYNSILTANAGANYTGIATIMTVVDYQQLVDNYNNVPYSQALKGVTNLTPAYDKGTDIYPDLMKKLDAAITMIQGAPATDANPGVSDIMFGGDMTSWVKYANTLKLRLALRVSENPNLTAMYATFKTAVAATEALGYLDGTVGAYVNPGYTNSDAFGGQQSPLWINYGYSQSGSANTNNQEYQANQYSIDFFTNNSDPRLTQVYAPNPDGNVIGSKFGATVTFPKGGVTPSKLGPGVLKDPSMDAVIMSSAEALFLQAEGVVKGLITGDAAALYNAGITNSFEFDLVGGTTAAADAAATMYEAQVGIVYPTGGSVAAQEEAIIIQKWAALQAYGAFEAFNDFRRTGYPNDIPLSIYPGANAPNQVTRIFYPFVEYSTNAANVAAQGTIDKFNSKIFWAK